MQTKIQLLEYEKQECALDDDFVSKFECYLGKNKLEKVIRFSRKEIISSNFVGVLKYKNVQFEILPKILAQDDNRNLILQNLIYMLSYTKNLEISHTSSAKLSKNKNPFLEVLIGEFANSLLDCLRRFVPKKYVREEDNLNFLKGKLKFCEHIKVNCANGAKFFCEYDDFSENNPLNQLFYQVAKMLYAISENSKNKNTLKIIINIYSDIKEVKFDKFKTSKIKLGKNQQLFSKPFKLALMFLENCSIDFCKNKFDNIALLWDMNILFEEFIFQFIKKELPQFNCQYQKGKRLLRHEDGALCANTFVDMFVPDKIILDTKYKKNSGKRNDFSNADIFQMIAYQNIHDINKAILIYPQYENDFSHNFTVNCEKRLEISLVSINLKLDLKKQKEKLKQELLEKIKI